MKRSMELRFLELKNLSSDEVPLFDASSQEPERYADPWLFPDQGTSRCRRMDDYLLLASPS